MADGLVEIRGVAREPGWRSKIAVISHVQGVDPVGACVGPRGSRVRMVVSELRGEKIDIIPFNEEPARYVAKALSPARVREVLVDDEDRQATVIVPDDQLSLAIGREGMNARLAARLTGWRIDIKSESTFAREEADDEFGDETEAGVSRCAAHAAHGQALPERRGARARATAPSPRTPGSRSWRARLGRSLTAEEVWRRAPPRAGSASRSSPPPAWRRATAARRAPSDRGDETTRARHVPERRCLGVRGSSRQGRPGPLRGGAGRGRARAGARRFMPGCAGEVCTCAARRSVSSGPWRGARSSGGRECTAS